MATFKGTATSNTSIIPASQTDYPEYVDLSNLPAAFWSTVKDGGGDIRCYSDAALTTELPREVVSCDTTAETGELHVKHDLSAGDDIYIDVDGTRSDYATNDTYGAENVWSDYVAIYHGDFTVDSTGNGNGATGNGGVTSGGATGNIGAATTFDGSDDYFSTPLDQSDFRGDSNLTWTAWIKIPVNPSNHKTIFSDNESGDGQIDLLVDDSPQGEITSGMATGNNWEGSINSTGTVDDDGWHLVGVRFEGSTQTHSLWIDTSQDGSQSTANSTVGDENDGTDITLYLGQRANNSNRFEGELGETRLTRLYRGDNWITTEYNNQNSPSTFRTWQEARAFKPRITAII